MADLVEIDVNNLKVGDTVAVIKETRNGWKKFRYGIASKETVTRITPKRTKFCTDKGEYDRYQMFYEYDDEAIRQSEVAMGLEKITECMWEIEKFRRNDSLYSLSDEQITAVASLYEQIVAEIAYK